MSHPSDPFNPSSPPNPFAPPGHQPRPPALPPQGYELPQQPQPQLRDPQAWAPVQHAGYAAPGAAVAPLQPCAPAPKGGNGLAITAVVLSGLALLGVLAMALFMGIGSAMGGSYLLSGTVHVVDQGASHSDLQDSLIHVIEDDGGSVDELVCPERSQVGQGLVTVCHGSVDGFDWTGVVVFEDDDGSYVVTEY